MPGRALPPSRRSSAWASTVLPAPVSPVSTLSPAASRSSARSIRSRFSTRSSYSTPGCLPAAADGTHVRLAPVLHELAELLPQAAVERRPGQLGEQRRLVQE